jgi:tyrosine-protein kinase Etk/Wzc
MSSDNSRSDFEAVNLLLFLWKGRKLILIVCILAAAGSIFASLSIREKYQSAAVIFPAKSNSITLFESDNPKNNLFNFGEEEEAEQLVQILQSSFIRDQIVEDYNLIERYEIDTTSSEWKYALHGEFEDNVTYRRTKFGSIEITVMDWEPDIAARMANDIVQLLDTVKNNMIKQRVAAAYEVIKNEYELTKANIDLFVDTLTSLGQLGVVSQIQRAEITAGYTRALISGRADAVAELKALIEVNHKYGSIHKGYVEKLENETKRLTELKSVYQQARANFEARLSYQFVSEVAFAADKKAYPIRWLIVVMACISAFVFSIFLLIVLDKFKEMRVRLKEEATATA